MSEKNQELDAVINKLEATMHADVSAFCQALRDKHIEEPEEYELNDGTAITDMFIKYLVESDF